MQKISGNKKSVWQRIAGFFRCLWNWLCRRGWKCQVPAKTEKISTDQKSVIVVESPKQTAERPIKAEEQAKAEEATILPMAEQKIDQAAPKAEDAVAEKSELEKPVSEDAQKTAPVEPAPLDIRIIEQVCIETGLNHDMLTNKVSWFDQNKVRQFTTFQATQEVAEVYDLSGAPFNPFNFDLYFTQTAWQVLFAYIRLNPKEVGGFGQVERFDPRDKNKFLVTEILLPKQVCSYAETDCSNWIPEMQEKMVRDGRAKDTKKNKLWWHSHHDMSVGPSSQDDRQMDTFNTGLTPYMIRGIFNKKNEAHITLYDYERKLKLIKHYYGLVCTISDDILEAAQKEVKAKVSTKGVW